MISSRFFHALGYYVPETYLVVFDRERLVVETNATDVTSIGETAHAAPRGHRSAAGARRAAQRRKVPRRRPPGAHRGRLADRPVPDVRHAQRRSERHRAARAPARPARHVRVLGLVEPQPLSAPSHPGCRHHRGWRPNGSVTTCSTSRRRSAAASSTARSVAWEGRRNRATVGGHDRQEHRRPRPLDARVDAGEVSGPAGGRRVRVSTFEPEKWTTGRPMRAVRQSPAGRHVLGGPTGDGVHRRGHPRHRADGAVFRPDGRTLDRRQPHRAAQPHRPDVLRAGASARSTSPCDGELAFADLAVQLRIRGAAPVPGGLVDVRQQGWQVVDALGVGWREVPLRCGDRSAGQLRARALTARGGIPAWPSACICAASRTALRVVGIDREWPGRTLVDPRVVVRPAETATRSSRPNGRGCSTPTPALNAKTGQNLSPDERFRALSPSEQTTFDGVTHALLHSSLTDDSGQPLGRAFDLVAILERIAGQQSGRSGDQQFRLYVTLRPKRATCWSDRASSSGTRRTRSTTPGYPHSYRLGAGAPSAQFSLAEDGLSADIDVDYRDEQGAAVARSTAISPRRTRMSGPATTRQRHDGAGTASPTGGRSVRQREVRRSLGHEAAGPFGTAPTRPPTPLPPNRPANASIPEVADAVQEFLTDWVIRRNYQEALAFLAPDAFACVADSMDIDPKRLAGAPAAGRPAAAREDGEPLGTAAQPDPGDESRHPVVAGVRVVKHAFEQDFTIVEAPTELGAQYAVRSDAAEEVRAVRDAAVRHVLRRPAAGRARRTAGRHDRVRLASRGRRVAARRLSRGGLSDGVP